MDSFQKILPTPPLMQMLVKMAFPYNSRKLPVRQLSICSSGCGVEECAQHQFTSCVQPCRATVKELDLATPFS